MINLIKIGDKEYGFHFGMRVFWHISNSGEIEFDEIDGRITSDYDSFLELFVIANKAAIDKEGKGESLTVKDLEFAIDDDPEILTRLQNAFATSKVIKKLQKSQEKTEKKPKG